MDLGCRMKSFLHDEDIQKYRSFKFISRFNEARDKLDCSRCPLVDSDASKRLTSGVKHLVNISIAPMKHLIVRHIRASSLYSKVCTEDFNDHEISLNFLL